MAAPAASPVRARLPRGSTRARSNPHEIDNATCATRPRGTLDRPRSVPAARVGARTGRLVSTEWTVDGSPLTTPATAAEMSRSRVMSFTPTIFAATVACPIAPLAEENER